MVTGLGGIFIKAKDPKFLARWYEDNLGIGFGSTLYFSFKWREPEHPSEISHTVFSFFKDDSIYFYPGTNDVMINLRVNNLDELRIRLKNDGAFVIDKVESYEYGRFGWVLDPQGNKIELWEPIDSGFEDRNYPMKLSSVNGLGGVFLKCPQPQELMHWYSKHFDMHFNPTAHTYRWLDFNNEKKEGSTVLSFFPEDSAYFQPSQKSFMLCLRVNELHQLIEELRSSGVEVLDKKEEYIYGKFGWMVDPEGNKIELWQPV